MGAVRIYKEDIGDKYVWHARAGGCYQRDAAVCSSLEDHELACDDFDTFETLLAELNDPNSYLGAYLKK